MSKMLSMGPKGCRTGTGDQRFDFRTRLALEDPRSATNRRRPKRGSGRTPSTRLAMSMAMYSRILRALKSFQSSGSEEREVYTGWPPGARYWRVIKEWKVSGSFQAKARGCQETSVSQVTAPT